MNSITTIIFNIYYFCENTSLVLLLMFTQRYNTEKTHVIGLASNQRLYQTVINAHLILIYPRNTTTTRYKTERHF